MNTAGEGKITSAEGRTAKADQGVKGPGVAHMIYEHNLLVFKPGQGQKPCVSNPGVDKHIITLPELNAPALRSGEWFMTKSNAEKAPGAKARDDPLVALESKETSLRIGWCWDHTMWDENSKQKRGHDTVIQYRVKGSNIGTGSQGWSTFFTADFGMDLNTLGAKNQNELHMVSGHYLTMGSLTPRHISPLIPFSFLISLRLLCTCVSNAASRAMGSKPCFWHGVRVPLRTVFRHAVRRSHAS